MAGPLAVTRTRVVLMRTTVLLLALLASLTACGDGGGEGGDNAGAGGAESVERTTTERAEEAIPLASEALGATEAEVYTQWQSCMAISSKYAAIGHLSAPEKDTAQQLESVRTALVEVGYDDVTQVEGHVTLERDGTTCRHPATGCGVRPRHVAGLGLLGVRPLQRRRPGTDRRRHPPAPGGPRPLSLPRRRVTGATTPYSSVGTSLERGPWTPPGSREMTRSEP